MMTSPSGLETKDTKEGHVRECGKRNDAADLPDKHLVHTLGAEGGLHEGGHSAGGHDVDLWKRHNIDWLETGSRMFPERIWLNFSAKTLI